MIQRRGPAQELRATIDRLPLDVRQAVLDGIRGQRIIAGAHADASGGVCPMVAADVHVPWKTVSSSSVKTAQEAARAWDRYAEVSGSSRTATKRQLLALTSMLEASILNEAAQTEMPLSDAIAEYESAKSGRRAAPAREYAARDYVPPVVRPEVPVTGHRYLSLADAYEVPAETQSTVDMPAHPPAPIEVHGERPTPVEVAPARQSPVEVPAPAHPSSLERPETSPRSRKQRRDTGERDRAAELGEREGWAWLRPFRSYDEYEETLLRALSELDTHERQLEELHAR